MPPDDSMEAPERWNMRVPLAFELMCAGLEEKDTKLAAMKVRLELADKAIEFAAYLAADVEQLIAALDSEHAARLAADDEDEDSGLEEAVQRVTEWRCEFANGVHRDIIEFRKRAERAQMWPLATTLSESNVTHTRALFGTEGPNPGEAAYVNLYRRPTRS